MFGTDAPQQFSVPGFSVQREIALMLQSGLTSYDILRSGTKNVGDYFKHKDNFGTVAVGQRADMILVDGNPLEDVANIAKRSGVMVRGRWLPRPRVRRASPRLRPSTALQPHADRMPRHCGGRRFWCKKRSKAVDGFLAAVRNEVVLC